MATGLTHSITFKVLGIGLLALLMLIPLAQVQGLIRERSALRDGAVANIARSFGGAQVVGGPVLAVPKRTRVQTSTGWTTQECTEILLPDRLNMHATLATEVRQYGIYATPVYVATLALDGSFLAADLRNRGGADTIYDWDRAELRLPIADGRGIRRVSALRVADAELPLGPGHGVAGFGAIAAAVDATRFDGERIPFALELTLAGTESLRFLPLARRTEASLTAPWPDPSFIGAFLPAERRIDAHGFTAQWQVLDLNRGFGQSWRQDAEHASEVGAAAFGVALYQPVGVYQQNERAGKYGVLFIALSFVAFFLFEVRRNLRVHPVQYLLVGLALATFYVVLLALSEHVGFTLAYLAAAAAVALLVGGYAAAVLRTRRGGALLGALLAFVYALLYGLVISEQYALLMGALALLATVAALMYLTRQVDWYRAASATPATTQPVA
jgi:inner membrane protein